MPSSATSGAAELEARYRARLEAIETQARYEAEEEIAKCRAEAAAVVHSEESESGAVSRATRRVLLALEGELVQETVVVEQLRATEAERESRLSKLEFAAEGGGQVGRPPPAPSHISSGFAVVREEAEQEQQNAKRLEQRAWRAENALRASEAHEELLEAHMMELERRAKETEVAAERDKEERCLEREERCLERELVSAAESQELAVLEARERESEAELERREVAEAEASESLEHARAKVLDLSSECGLLLFGSGLDGDAEASRTRVILERMLPNSRGLRLDELLAQLEEEHVSARQELVAQAAAAASTDGMDPLLIEDYEQTESLALEVQTCEEKAARQSERLGIVELEALAADAGGDDFDAQHAELSRWHQENEALRDQQEDWRRSLPQMLQSIEDPHKQRVAGGALRAALALAGTSGAQGVPEEPEVSEDTIRSENAVLQRQVHKLEEDKIDLIRSQQSLIAFVKSKMPALEDAVTKELRQKESRANGDEHT